METASLMQSFTLLAKLDEDGDGVPEPPGDNYGILRGDFGRSFVKKAAGHGRLIDESASHPRAWHRRRGVFAGDRHTCRCPYPL